MRIPGILESLLQSWTTLNKRIREEEISKKFNPVLSVMQNERKIQISRREFRGIDQKCVF